MNSSSADNLTRTAFCFSVRVGWPPAFAWRPCCMSGVQRRAARWVGKSVLIFKLVVSNLGFPVFRGVVLSSFQSPTILSRWRSIEPFFVASRADTEIFIKPVLLNFLSDNASTDTSVNRCGSLNEQNNTVSAIALQGVQCNCRENCFSGSGLIGAPLHHVSARHHRE